MVKKDILLAGLPAIYYNGKYLVFSSYIKQIAILDSAELKSKNILMRLKKAGFFGNPKQKKFDPKITTITLGLTNDCNFRCKYCYGNYGGFSKKDYMNKETALTVIKRVIKSNTKEVRITFFGGEPTLAMDVIKACINYVKKLSLNKTHFHISTNGFISKQNLQYLLKNNFTFNVSYDGIPESQNFQRPMAPNIPSSKYVEKTIKELVNNNSRFKVKCVITEHNVDKMASAVDYLSRLGVKYIHFERVSLTGRAVKGKIKEPEPKEFINNFFKALDRAEKHNIKIINSAYTNLFSPSTFYCTHIAGEAYMVGPKGIRTNCYEHLDDTNSPFYLGDLNDKRVTTTKNKIKNNYDVNKIKACKSCPIKYICGGGCPQQNYVKTGKLFVPDKKECWIKKQIIRKLIIKMYKNSKINFLINPAKFKPPGQLSY